MSKMPETQPTEALSTESPRPMTAYDAVHGRQPGIVAEETRRRTAVIFAHALAENIMSILGLDPQDPTTHIPAVLAIHQTGPIKTMRVALSKLMRTRNGDLTLADIQAAVPIETTSTIQEKPISNQLLKALSKIPANKELLPASLN